MSAVTPREIFGGIYASWQARAPPRGSRVTRILGLFVVGFTMTIAAALTVPLAFGYHCFAVLSGSMEPTISTGDVVVVRQDRAPRRASRRRREFRTRRTRPR